MDKNQQYIDKLLQTKVPILLLINKIDLSNQEELNVLVEKWENK